MGEGGGWGEPVGPAWPAGLERRVRPNFQNKLLFLFFFKQIAPQFLFEQEKLISRVWCKNESFLEFDSLQLCLKVHFKIPTRF
jgi:hypothetical protein